MHTFSKSGKEVDFRPGNSHFLYSDGTIYSENKLTTTISYGETETDKNKLLFKFYDVTEEFSEEGAYNAIIVTHITYYQIINADGTIKDVSTYVPEDE